MAEPQELNTEAPVQVDINHLIAAYQQQIAELTTARAEKDAIILQLKSEVGALKRDIDALAKKLPEPNRAARRAAPKKKVS